MTLEDLEGELIPNLFRYGANPLAYQGDFSTYGEQPQDYRFITRNPVDPNDPNAPRYGGLGPPTHTEEFTERVPGGVSELGGLATLVGGAVTPYIGGKIGEGVFDQGLSFTDATSQAFGDIGQSLNKTFSTDFFGGSAGVPGGGSVGGLSTGFNISDGALGSTDVFGAGIGAGAGGNPGSVFPGLNAGADTFGAGAGDSFFSGFGGPIGSGIGAALFTGFTTGDPIKAAKTGVGTAVGTAVGNAIFPGIGGVIGGALGGSIGGRAICTMLYRKGLMPKWIWMADVNYTPKLHPWVVSGYRSWCYNLVDWLDDHPKWLPLVRKLSLWRGQEIAYQYGVALTPSYLGKLTRFIGESVCFVIGGLHAGYVRRTWRTGRVARA